MAGSQRLQQLIEELKRRRVFRVATLYVVAMWPMIQIVDILSPALGLPDDAMRTLLIIFIAGFPVVILLAWLFNLTPKGLVKNSDTQEEDGEARLISKHFELILVSMLLVTAIGLFMFQGNFSTNTQQMELTEAEAGDAPISIAVLPFVPFSEDLQDAYFADGLSEELLNVLAKNQKLRVAARTSSFAYKGVTKNIQEVGRELGVNNILEGSVRRNDVDNTIRVTAQLIDVETGAHLWSETYDRQFSDVFKIQDEITAAVVDELKVTLLGDDNQMLMTHETASPEAMVAHTMGREELAKRTSTSVEAAARYFKKAVNDDPTYARAYASLAESYALMIQYSNKPRDEYNALAQDAVNQALRLDPNSGLAWAAQGLIYFGQENKQDEAREALKKAIELNPSYAMAYMWYGSLLDDIGERNKYHKKAFELDPKSAVAGYNVANNYADQGDDKAAMETFSKIVEADPFYPGAYRLVGEISRSRGRLDQAVVQYKKAYSLDPDLQTAINIGHMYADLEDGKNTAVWLEKIKEKTKNEPRIDVVWLEFFSSLLNKDQETAEKTLLPYRDVESENLFERLNSVMVNYVLKDPVGAIKAYEKSEEIRRQTEMDPPLLKFMEAYVAAAYSYQLLEQPEQAEPILTALNQELDEYSTKGLRLTPQMWYHKALVQALSGEKQMSLVTLQRAIDEGFSESLRMSFEPILDELKDDENFIAMNAGLTAKMNLMREQLAFEESFNTTWSE